jgi:protein-S-isoprenylcysteine O-methyltransferase Ste14
MEEQASCNPGLAMTTKTISILATFILIGAALTLLLRGGLLATGPVSASVQIAGVLMVVWARLTMGMRSFHFAANPTPGPLITSGPYRYIRNPIYAAAWLVIWTGVIVHFSRVNATLALAAAGTLLVKIACEEKFLRETYPEYADYARKTKRLIPFVV